MNLKWIKTGADVAMGAARKPALWGAVLAGASLVAGATLWHGHVAGKAIKAARADGANSVRLEQLAADNRSLINQAERGHTLTASLTKAKNEAHQSQIDLSGARARSAGAGQRLREQSTDLNSRIAATECPVVRGFAADAYRTASACRGDIESLGLGVGGLVESAESAHYEHARAEALMKFALPETALTPKVKP